MAQLVVSAAGAAIGFFATGGNPVGAQLGWAAGSLLFAATQSGPKTEGPRLADLSVSTSSYGTPIPYVQGHPRVAGQIIWASSKREIATTTEEGKGGGAEYTSYTYEVDLLILLTDNVIAGVSRVWSNGELIWSSLTGSDDGTLAASSGTNKWQRMTVYTGAPTQLPDPTYEAAVGTANAPAYRGRGSVMVQGLQLGGNGQLPNLTFEVFTAATSATRDVTLLLNFDDFANPFADASAYKNEATSIGAKATVGRFDSGLGISSLAELPSPPAYGDRLLKYQNAAFVAGVNVDFTIEFWVYFNSFIRLADFFIFRNTTAGTIDVGVALNSGGALRLVQSGGFNVSLGTAVVQQWIHLAVARSGSTIRCFKDGVQTSSAQFNGNFPNGFTADELRLMGFGGANDPVDCVLDGIRMTRGHARYTADFAVPSSAPADDSGTNYTLISPTLSGVVSALCLRTGLAASQFDVTGLAAITKPVRALAVSQVSSTRSVLDILAAAYFFEGVLSDKIYFRPRGAASVATLAYDELGYSADGASQADPLALRQANELELPAQVALTYSNVDADYQTDTQYSDRLLTGQDSTSAMQVPLAFTAAEAKSIADAMLMDRAAGLISTSISLGLQHTRLEPGDVVLLTGEDSSTYRMRLTRRADADGVLRFDAVLDDASVFSQAGVTTGGTTSQTVVMALPNTTLELLDIAILRDADNLPGHYVALKGANSSWASAGVYSSLDNASYTLSQTIGTQAVIGICSSTLGAWAGGNIFDEMNSVTVSVGDGQLASVTRDALLNDQTVNAALVGSELIQYRDAALLSTGVYLLSGLLRGRRGTEYSMTGHAANERFVKLGNAGMRFVALQSSDLGRLRYYKGVTAGQRLSAVTAKTITPAGVGLECFAPVDARADRTTTDTVLSWKRRTRLSTRLVGALPISAPLGETTESYEVEVYSSAAFTTLKRTLTSSTPSVTYTSAQQITDFGANQATLYLRIYQMSATVGRGYVLQATV